MARMGRSTYLSRYNTPWFFPLLRKEHKWSVSISPGPHPARTSVPLGILLRDVMNVAMNLREARRILSERLIQVDSRVVTNYNFPVGLMDVVSSPKYDMYFRVVPDRVKFMKLVQISKEESSVKYVRLMSKTLTGGGRLQLNLEDGRNFLVPTGEESKYNFPTLGTIKYSLSMKTIEGYIPVNEGNYVIVIGGKNVGVHGVLKSLKLAPYKRRKYSVAVLESPDGKQFQTNLQNLMIIGQDKPEIKVE
jgi:small subunit ribosomal protein S4e